MRRLLLLAVGLLVGGAGACSGDDPAPLPPAPAVVKLVDLEDARIEGGSEDEGNAELLLAEDFEDGPGAWRLSDDVEDPLHPLTGRIGCVSLREEAGLTLNGERGSLYCLVEAEPDTCYELTGSVRTRGLMPERPELFFGGTLFVGELSAYGTPEEVFANGLSAVMLAGHELPKATGDTDWTEHRRVIRTGESTRALVIACVLSTPGSITAGEVDFRKIRLRRVSREGYWRDLLAQAVRGRQPGDPTPEGWRGERLVRGTLGAEARPSVALLPGERISFRMRLPEGAPRLRTGIGPFADALTGKEQGELVFTARLDGETILRESVALPARAIDARWTDVDVDLAAHAGAEVILELAVEGSRPGTWGAPTLRDTSARPEGANVLLVSIDTLRADHVHSYGYSRETSPRLDALAAEGARFADCTAQAPYTLPSHVSMFSAQHPSVHGVQEAGCAISSARTPMLAEILSERGWTTQAFTGGGYLSPVFGFARGFDGYCNVDPFRHATSEHLEAMIEKQPELITRELFLEYGPARIERWITDHADERFLLFLHTYAVHDFDPPPGYVERFPGPLESDIEDFFPYFDYRYITEHGIPDEILAYMIRHYDAALLHVDELIGRILDHVEALGLHDETIVVVTSDHGKELTERGIIGHGVTLYEELTRVPLIVRVPGMEPRIVTEPSMGVDIPPMILGAMGIPADPRMQGVDLLRESAPPRAIWSEVVDPLAHKYALRGAGGWKLIHGPDEREVLFVNEIPWELYDLANDHGEKENVFSTEDDRAERMARALRELRTGYEDLGKALGELGAGELDEVTLAQLRQLGYIR